MGRRRIRVRWRVVRRGELEWLMGGWFEVYVERFVEYGLHPSPVLLNTYV
jgi:hypothetical protein